MKNILPIFLVSTLFLASCSLSPCGFNKDAFMDKHEQLVQDAKKNKKRWGDSDWESRDANMKKMVEECYENYEEEMSNKEIGRFWAGTGSYYYNRHGKSFIRKLKRSEEDISEALEKGLESFVENNGESLKDWIDENLAEELGETLEEVGEDLKELGKELEEMFKE